MRLYVKLGVALASINIKASVNSLRFFTEITDEGDIIDNCTIEKKRLNLYGSSIHSGYICNMKTSTVYIEQPSKGLLDLVRKLKADKDARQTAMKSEWAKYFPKEK